MFKWGVKRARRDADTAGWVDSQRASTYAAGGQSLLILQVYQRVKRGAKAYVYLDDQPWKRDAFFWDTSVTAGTMVLVRTATGWGPHTNRNDVLWIGSKHQPAADEILAVISAGDLKRWQRHNRRTARNGG